MKKPNSAMLWDAEKRLYEREFYSFTSSQTTIHEITQSDELAYTVENRDIYMSPYHHLVSVLPKEQQPVFRRGVFCHEMLHHMFTDFMYFNTLLSTIHDGKEKRILANLINLVDDPAIEYSAPTRIGGSLLQSLRFSIEHVYTQSPPLEESSSPMSQLFNALVMFGDMGLIKGHWTFPEAKEAFLKMIPSFNRAVTMSISSQRMDEARKWLDITRPLWERETQDEESFSRMISEMEQSLSTMPKGKNEPSVTPDPSVTPKKDERAERREEAARKASTIFPDVDEHSSDGVVQKPSDSDEILDELLDSLHSSNNPKLVKDIKKLSEEMWDKIVSEKESMEKEQEEESVDIPLPKAYSNTNIKVGKASCLNIVMDPSERTERLYAKLKSSCMGEIRLLSSRLKRIFANDQDEMVRRTSGKYDITKDLSHTSAKVFLKRKEKRNINDLCVLLLIDCSGSMCEGKKMELARKTACLLAETFASLSIPLSVVGFTADDKADVVHYHAVGWKNNIAMRSTIVDLKPHSDNDDAYSIRYATEMLKKRREQHKLLFVVSDGFPSCYRYASIEDGVAKTKEALVEARKVATVYGVGVDIKNDEVSDCYGRSYIDANMNGSLSATIANVLQHTLKKI